MTGTTITTPSLRPRQAALFLGISTATLWRWHAQRADMPRARRLSARCSVFDREELISWRDAQPKGSARIGTTHAIATHRDLRDTSVMTRSYVLGLRHDHKLN